MRSLFALLVPLALAACGRIGYVGAASTTDGGTIGVEDGGLRDGDPPSVPADGGVEDATVGIDAGPVVTLSVAVTDDENDFGAALPTLTEAALISDLSLREALLVAEANPATPVRIALDGSLSGTVLLFVSASLGPLPTITRSNLVIDGAGTEFYIEGVEITNGHGLHVRGGSDIEIRNLIVKYFTGTDGDPEGYACIMLEDATRVTIESVSFFGCGANTTGGGQLRISGGSGHVIRSAAFLEGLRDGIRTAGEPVGLRIEESSFNMNADDGIAVDGTGHVIRNNEVRDNGDIGIAVDSADSVQVLGNEIHGGVWGIQVWRDSAGGLFEGNIIDGASGAGIDLMLAGQARFTMRGNTFIDVATPIALAPSANEGVGPPTIASFTGDQVTGTTSGPGTIEVYGFSGGWLTPIATAPSTGAFDVGLPSPETMVGLLFTNATGSTSAMIITGMID